MNHLGSMSALPTMLMWSVVLIAAAVFSGRWTFHIVSDTASYLQYAFSPASAAAAEIRSPVYPLVLRLLTSLAPTRSSALQLVVLGQILLHAAATSALMLELRNWKTSCQVSFAVAATVAIGCTFWDNVSTIATDCPAMSVGVITAVCMMRGWRRGFSIRLSIATAAFVLTAIGLRPAYLFLIPWTAISLFLRPAEAVAATFGHRVRDGFVIAGIPVVTLLGWCVFRYVTVADFSLLPFGHQNMAAVTTQLLDNDELTAIPGKPGELASEIARRRVEVSLGENLRATSNKTSQISDSDKAQVVRTTRAADGLDLRTHGDPSRRADSYMTLENRWDAMTYLVVVPAAAHVIQTHASNDAVRDADIVAQHQLIAELDKYIVRSYPLRYARWWLLAMRRGLWGSAANIVMHPIFLILIVVAALITTVRCIHPSRAETNRTSVTQSLAGVRAFLLIAITYGATKLGFVALTSPPIGRFSDAAFVFVPGVIAIAYFAFQQCLRFEGMNKSLSTTH
ncbi:signal peptide protein [Rhodopirellula sp. SWK7]|nr:signal peptide protein [Rhodopirellula sp. SWK7]